MPLTVQNLTTLSQDDYDAARQLVLSMLQEAYPDFDLYGGALDQLLLSPGAILEAANQETVDRVRLASSLLGITQDPTLTDTADEDVTADLASNYNITPTVAEQSSGSIAIVISVLTPTVVAGGTIFADPSGNTYSTTQTFTGKVSQADVVASTDVLIKPLGDNVNFVFQIQATAVNGGTAENISRLTTLTTTATIANFVKAFASTDFTGGVNAETNTSLINRVRTGLASATPASRSGLDALYRTLYPELVGDSTVGFGDPEMIRNHSALPISMPGRVDSYVQTQAPPQTTQVLVTALLVAAAGGGKGTWQISLTRVYAPIYKITAVCLAAQALNPNANNYPITSQTPGYDLTPGTPPNNTPGLTYFPDVISALEAAFSRYQTLTFQFTDTDTSISGLTIGVSTASYAVTYLTLPGIAALQDLAASRPNRSLMGDCLVCAPVPVFVTPTININENVGAAAVVPGAVAQAVATAINETGFIGSLPASTVQAAAQAALPVGSVVTSVTLSGSLIRADSVTVSLSGTPNLGFTNDYPHRVSTRTVCFYCLPAAVVVNVTPVTPPES